MATKRRTTTRRRRTYSRPPARRRRRSTKRSSASSWTEIFVATIAMTFITKILKQLLGSQLQSLPAYGVPLIVYFLAKKGIIPVAKLDVIAQTIVARQVAGDLNLAGFYSGFTYGEAPQRPTPAQQVPAYRPMLKRTPAQTRDLISQIPKYSYNA